VSDDNGNGAVKRLQPGERVKLGLAEAVGLHAIRNGITQNEHEQRQLLLKLQELQVANGELVEQLEGAWKEVAKAHGIDETIPVGAFDVDKKNRATLNPQFTYPTDTPGERRPETNDDAGTDTEGPPDEAPGDDGGGSRSDDDGGADGGGQDPSEEQRDDD